MGVAVGVACVLAWDDMHPSSVYLDYVHTEPTEHSTMLHSTFQNLFTIYVSLHYTIYHTILYIQYCIVLNFRRSLILQIL